MPKFVVSYTLYTPSEKVKTTLKQTVVTDDSETLARQKFLAKHHTNKNISYDEIRPLK